MTPACSRCGQPRLAAPFCRRCGLPGRPLARLPARRRDPGLGWYLGLAVGTLLRLPGWVIRGCTPAPRRV